MPRQNNRKIGNQGTGTAPDQTGAVFCCGQDAAKARALFVASNFVGRARKACFLMFGIGRDIYRVGRRLRNKVDAAISFDLDGHKAAGGCRGLLPIEIVLRPRNLISRTTPSYLEPHKEALHACRSQ